MLGFTYQLDKTNKMTISHHGRAIKILKSATALGLQVKLEKADHQEQQRLMASATGKYKRGNEKV